MTETKRILQEAILKLEREQKDLETAEIVLLKLGAENGRQLTGGAILLVTEAERKTYGELEPHKKALEEIEIEENIPF